MSKQSNLPLSFEGKMVIPLQVDVLADYEARAKFTGDFKLKRKRKKIMSKPRKWHVNLYLFNVNGEKMHIKYVTPTKMTDLELIDTLKQQADKLIKESKTRIPSFLEYEDMLRISMSAEEAHELARKTYQEYVTKFESVPIELGQTFASIRA